MKLKYRFTLFCAAFITISATLIDELPPMNGLLDLSHLDHYVLDTIPFRAEYRYNESNPVTDIGATLGRVLFYDKKLSVNESISCASCHQQENAFGDSRKVSIGFDGEKTHRHAMRLINVDFHADNFKFWDERVSTLENMTTSAIKDSIEMGFSGINGFPGIDSLITRMSELSYYPELFYEVFGDSTITEQRMADALAQFIRSISTFDSKFDEGFFVIQNENSDFPNFTDQENLGKRLFFAPPFGIVGNSDRKGAACGFCHKAPGGDIIHITANNGVIGVANDSTLVDVSVQRSPSLKNLVKPDGSSNGPFMHDGSLETLEDVIEHYNHIPFDPRNTEPLGLLFPLPSGEVRLHLTQEEKDAVIAFLKTLSGPDVYTNEKWSDPFDANGNIEIINSSLCSNVNSDVTIAICEGESYGGRTQPGIYRDTYPLSNGCDSIVNLELVVFESSEVVLNEEYCEDDPNIPSGPYQQILIDSNGCDSVIITNIVILQSSITNITQGICKGDSVFGITEPGNYTIEFEGLNGCDSLINLELSLLSSGPQDLEVTICSNEEYEGYTETGTYTLDNINQYGCDSITFLMLTVLEENHPDCMPSSALEVTAETLSFWPNPVSDKLHYSFSISEPLTFKLFNSNASLVMTKTISGTKSHNELIDLSSFSEGLYWLQVLDRNSQLIHVERIIKLR